MRLEKLNETKKLEEYYELDRQIRSGQLDAVNPSEVEGLVDKYRESTEILKLAMSYYVQTSDYEEAKELARTLLDKGHSAEIM